MTGPERPGDPDSVLGRVPLLRRLAPPLRARLAAIARPRAVPAGTILADEADSRADVGYVVEGALGMTQVLADGRVHIVGLLLPTDLYGRVFDGPPAHRLAALTDSLVLAFPRKPFEALLAGEPELERLFLVELEDELDAARDWVLLLSGHTATERIAAFLLILARRARERGAREPGVGPVRLRLPVGRVDLAHHLGTRPETLSRALHRLADEGVIRIGAGDRVDVLDLDRLVGAAGQDPEPEIGGRVGQG